MKIPFIQNFSYSGTWTGPSINLGTEEIRFLMKLWNSKWLFVLLAASILVLYQGIKWFRLKRLVEDTPTSKIRAIAMGLVEVHGKAKQYKDNIVTSPLTGRKCIFYDYVIEGHMIIGGGHGKKKEWTPLKGDIGFAPYFKLKDETGEVLVKTENAGGLISERQLDDRDYNYDITPEKAKSIKLSVKGLANLTKMNIKMAKKLRFHEFIVKPGDELYVMGTAGDNPFVEEATAQHGAEDIMIYKGRHDKAFYISEKQERGLIPKLQRNSMICIIMGTLMILSSVTIILINFGLF